MGGNSSAESTDRGALAGEIVAGHELLRSLAAGGMGEIYLARHRALGMERAIKVIRTDLRDDGAARERFVREAQVLARLQHNSIVQIIDFGELPNGWPFLAMEYIDGPNLDQVVEKGPMPLPSALLVLEQIALALDYAHKRSVIHRDLKPGNVLVRDGDVRQVKVIDFGLAYTQGTEAHKRLTLEGQLVGSPLYMAPEQADGRLDVTQAVDVYAFGGIAYTLITGIPPFHGMSLLRLIAAHADDVPPRVSSRFPDVPPFLDSLLFACLAKDPSARPHSEELAGHLTRLARQTETTAPASASVQPGAPPSSPRAAQVPRPPILPASSPAAQTAQGRRASKHEKTKPPPYGVAAKPSPAAAAPVVASPHVGGPRPVYSASASSLLLRAVELPAPEDEAGLGAALAHQILAVIGEIATHVSAANRALPQMLQESDGLRESLINLEMEMAIVNSRLDDASAHDRAELERERRGLAHRIDQLRTGQLDLYRQLIPHIEAARVRPTPVVEQLFRELDRSVAQLEDIRRRFP